MCTEHYNGANHDYSTFFCCCFENQKNVQTHHDITFNKTENLSRCTVINLNKIK